MKHAGPIELRNVLLAPEAFGRPVKRKGFLKRLIIALHLSRRRQARDVIRRHRDLLAQEPWGEPLGVRRSQPWGQPPQQERKQ